MESWATLPEPTRRAILALAEIAGGGGGHRRSRRRQHQRTPTARVEFHPIVIEHLRAIVEFTPLIFDWPHHERTLWTDFATLKAAAGIEFPGAFHRLRFGFANANVDSLDADLLQKLMRHHDPQTTRKYINAAERMKRAGTASKLHVPAIFSKATG